MMPRLRPARGSRRLRVSGCVALMVVLVGACSTASGGGSTPPDVEITVYAAASLKRAVEAARAAYEIATPGVTLTIATDSSATLRAQIEQGAPADLFLSADGSNPKKLVSAGLADGAAVDFAGNTLVVIVPTANPAGIATPADLADHGVKIVAAGAAVPIAKYATQVIKNLAGQPGYPAGFVAAYDANVVSQEDNVTAVVAKIELGEGDAAVVYATDAKAPTKVTTIDIPAVANVQATYAGVVVRASERREAARAFLAWLAGHDGGAVLARFGFLPPS